MESIEVKKVKKWAKENCPPLSWQRVVFRILPQLNQKGVFLHFLEKDNYQLSQEVFLLINQTFFEIFKKKMQIEEQTASALSPEQLVSPIPSVSFEDKAISVQKLKEAFKKIAPTAWSSVILAALPSLYKINKDWQYLSNDEYQFQPETLKELDATLQKLFKQSLKDIL
jgi:hypothetical protein